LNEEFRAPLHGQAFSNPVEVDRPAENDVEVLERRSRNVVAAGVSEHAERLLLQGLAGLPGSTMESERSAGADAAVSAQNMSLAPS
jgi:hypothetical protein